MLGGYDMQNEKIDDIIEKIEKNIEFLNHELNTSIESFAWKTFVEGQKYAYQNILEQIYKEKIERVWNS